MTTDSPWTDRLDHALADPARPVFVAGRATLTAGALSADRAGWRGRLLDAGLAPGDRLLLALPPGAEFLGVLAAAFDLSLTIVLLPPDVGIDHALEQFDARIAVAPTAGRCVLALSAVHASPRDAAPRAASGPPAADVRILLRTSGSSGHARWIALSDANLLAVLDSHVPALALRGARVLSVLPWHHVFGLVLDALASVLGGAVLVRDPSGGRDLAGLLALAADAQVTHLNAVPLLVDRLVGALGGLALLRSLAGGLIGGAPVRGRLAEQLATTRLRVGYGQTEAAPGVCLGAPGEWRDGILGRPLGCEVRTDEHGELHFRGANAAIGRWEDGRLQREAADRWVPSGDLVRCDPDGVYRFIGRRSAEFKLANGRMVAAAVLEDRLRRQVAGLEEVVVGSRDAAALDIWLTLGSGAGDPVVETQIADALGALAAWPRRVHLLPGDAWPRTAKGEVDRVRLAAG